MPTDKQQLHAATRPTAFIAFGGTGDVAKKKFYPALYHLSLAKLLPKPLYIVGVARRGVNEKEYRRVIEQAVRTNIGKKPLNRPALQRLLQHAVFFSGDLTKPAVYSAVEQFIESREKQFNKPIQRLFYLGLPPKIFPYVFDNVQTCRMGSAMCSIHQILSRIIIEKPFGYDQQSAQELQQRLSAAFDERQIYRMDHYLGKEAVQNILLFRFGNAIFDGLWNRDEIRAIQVTALETLGVEDRANYYERTGALRDVLQNHLLQLVAYATMDQPTALTTAEVHAAKEQILKQTALWPAATQFVRGQYATGTVDGKKVIAYRGEPNVDPRSTTETYAAVKLAVNTPRWQGIPIYLRSGKRMGRKVSEITYVFRRPQNLGFLEQLNTPIRSSFVTIRLDPDPGISIRVNVKRPGLSMELAPADLHFCYQETFGMQGVAAYERLLLDVIEGNQLLFTSSREVDEFWRIMHPVLDAFQKNQTPLHFYKAGSLGPAAAADLPDEEGERWIDDTLDICKRAHC